jgi:hypothetical protein
MSSIHPDRPIPRRVLPARRRRRFAVGALIAAGALGVAVAPSAAHGPTHVQATASRFPGSADSIERWVASWIDSCVTDQLAASSVPGVADSAERAIDARRAQLLPECTRTLGGDDA